MIWISLFAFQRGDAAALQRLGGRRHALAATVRRLPALPARERPVGAKPVHWDPRRGRRLRGRREQQMGEELTAGSTACCRELSVCC